MLSATNGGWATNPRQTTLQDQRRMANCLLAARFERTGKFTSGKQRNQVRFTRAPDKGEFVISVIGEADLDQTN